MSTSRLGRALALAAAAGALALPQTAGAQDPSVVDPDLAVRTVVEGLSQPTTMAFIGDDDILVNQKADGQVRRVTNGVLQPDPVLDLAVNSNSERGLLGIALDRKFHVNGWVYLYWTESSTGADSSSNGDVALLGNRLDRFVWDGSTLTFDVNLIRMRAAQPEFPPETRAFGNHDGGVLKVDRRGKIYLIVGDTGRRGLMQNLRCGPVDRYDCPPGTPVADDGFGGPLPDDAHLTGVILRLNPDGSAPRFNPFYRHGEEVGGEVGENIQKIFAYGIRNSFGMAFDPVSKRLWAQENGDDSYSELNLVEGGMNSGWLQIMGPASRVPDFKAIETSPEFFGMQQARYSPENLADTPAEALSRLTMLPGAHFSDPELAWRFEVGPGGMGFQEGMGLGREYKSDLFMGGSRNFLEGGHIFHFDLTANRKGIDVSADPRLADLVADNLDKWEITESETLLFGRNFGISTDIQTGTNGNLFVLSLSNGAIYEIHRP